MKESGRMVEIGRGRGRGGADDLALAGRRRITAFLGGSRSGLVPVAARFQEQTLCMDERDEIAGKGVEKHSANWPSQDESAFLGLDLKLRMTTPSSHYHEPSVLANAATTTPANQPLLKVSHHLHPKKNLTGYPPSSLSSAPTLQSLTSSPSTPNSSSTSSS